MNDSTVKIFKRNVSERNNKILQNYSMKSIRQQD